MWPGDTNYWFIPIVESHSKRCPVGREHGLSSGNASVDKINIFAQHVEIIYFFRHVLLSC